MYSPQILEKISLLNKRGFYAFEKYTNPGWYVVFELDVLMDPFDTF